MNADFKSHSTLKTPDKLTIVLTYVVFYETQLNTQITGYNPGLSVINKRYMIDLLRLDSVVRKWSICGASSRETIFKVL